MSPKRKASLAESRLSRSHDPRSSCKLVWVVRATVESIPFVVSSLPLFLYASSLRFRNVNVNVRQLVVTYTHIRGNIQIRSRQQQEWIGCRLHCITLPDWTRTLSYTTATCSDEAMIIRCSVIRPRLSRVLAHLLNEVVHIFKAPLHWLRDGEDALTTRGISLEPRLRCRPGAVHAVDFDAVTGRRDMKVPTDTPEVSISPRRRIRDPHFQAERTKVGSVLHDESQVRTQNSTQPSASTGTAIFQRRQAW